MPTATIRARTKPYPEQLRANERVCARCGIKYRFRPDRENWTECRDCRDVEGNHVRAERAYNPRTTAPFNPDKCGTTAGFYQHGRHDMYPCPPCLEAQRKYNRDRKRAKAKTRRETNVCGTVAGWSRHKRAGNEPCEPCTAAQRQYERDYYHTKRKIAA